MEMTEADIDALSRVTWMDWLIVGGGLAPWALLALAAVGHLLSLVAR